MGSSWVLHHFCRYNHKVSKREKR